MKKIFFVSCAMLAVLTLQAAPLADRFVWVFGWDLDKDKSISEISQLLETASQHGINGAVFSGFDALEKDSPEKLQRLEQLRDVCEKKHLEFIPSVFSVGYGGGFLAVNRNLAEGVPVNGAKFVVENGNARMVPDSVAKIANGDFENFKGNKLSGFDFHDQPGEISFIDTKVRHGGNASLRFEHFTANQYGHGRIMQKVKVIPHRSYRLTLWVKTEQIQPGGCFQVLILADGREIAPRKFDVPSTTDWKKITMLFNSLDLENVMVYAGVWGAKDGKFWLDDWSLEEVGPVNVLRRPGTPFRVQSNDETTLFTEGSDYVLKMDPINPWRDDGEFARIQIPEKSRIHNGDLLKVSWFHSMVIYDSQVTVCMGEPEVDLIIDREAKILAERFHPKRVLLSMDEVRMGGTCDACRGRNMAEIIGQCVSKQAERIRHYSPGTQVYVWSDMFDPKHNAKPDYYLVKGDFTGSWNYLPKDIIIAVWGGEPRVENMRFFSEHGFETLAACYYDADDLKDVKAWLDLVRKTPKARGLMYTPWERKYSLLPAFGDLLQDKQGQ